MRLPWSWWQPRRGRHGKNTVPRELSVHLHPVRARQAERDYYDRFFRTAQRPPEEPARPAVQVPRLTRLERDPFPTQVDFPAVPDRRYLSAPAHGPRRPPEPPPVPVRVCAGREAPNNGDYPGWVREILGASTTAEAVAEICAW